MGVVFALFASLSAALGFVLLKRSYQDYPPSVAFLFDVIFGILIWIPFSLIVGFNFFDLPTVFVFALISAVLSEAFVFYVLSKGEISITGTLFASYPIYTILFSLLFNNERLELIHWLFIALTILGTLIVSLPKKVNKGEFAKKTFIAWAIAGAVAVGLSDSLSKNVIDRTSAESFLFALALAQIPVALIYLRMEKQSLRQFVSFAKNYSKYKFAILGSFFNIICVLFLWLAFQRTFASIASPLTATYPVIILVLAHLFLKEKISRKDLIGLAITFLGIIGISYFY